MEARDVAGRDKRDTRAARGYAHPLSRTLRLEAAGEIPEHRVDAAHQGLCERMEPLARGRDRYARTGALEELRAEFELELAHTGATPQAG